MSAFLIKNYGDRIEMLTDGAVYEADGTLIGTREKVYRLANLPAALTGRGMMDALEIVGTHLDAFAAVTGNFDESMKLLQRSLDGMSVDDCPDAFEIAIAGFSESQGPMIGYFTTTAYVEDIRPFTLYVMDDAFGGGPEVSAEETSGVGINPDSVAGGLAERGADIMEIMRRKKGPNPTAPDLPEVFGIGGHVDLTTICANGSTTTRLRTWDDKIGEKINPFACEKVEAA